MKALLDTAFLRVMMTFPLSYRDPPCSSVFPRTVALCCHTPSG